MGNHLSESRADRRGPPIHHTIIYFPSLTRIYAFCGGGWNGTPPPKEDVKEDPVRCGKRVGRSRRREFGRSQHRRYRSRGPKDDGDHGGVITNAPLCQGQHVQHSQAFSRTARKISLRAGEGLLGVSRLCNQICLDILYIYTFLIMNERLGMQKRAQNKLTPPYDTSVTAKPWTTSRKGWSGSRRGGVCFRRVTKCDGGWRGPDMVRPPTPSPSSPHSPEKMMILFNQKKLLFKKVT